MKAKFAELCRANPDVVFLMVNVGDHADIADRFTVSSIPAFRFIKNGITVDEFVGSNDAALAEKIAALK